MRKYILFLLLLCAPLAKADCNSAPPVSFGGMTCVFASGTASVTSNNSGAAAVSFSGLAATDVVFFAMYFCTDTACATAPDWTANHSYIGKSGGIGGGAAVILPTSNNPCKFTYVYAVNQTNTSGGAPPTFNTNSSPCMSQTGTVSDGSIVWTPLYPVPSDSSGARNDCNFSPNSPFSFSNGGTFPNFLAYCPVLGSGRTAWSFNCSVTASCSFASIFVAIFSGGCTAANGCVTTDGSSNCNSCTSLNATTGVLTFTNELVFALGGTTNDETLTAGGGCTDLMAAVPGNANKFMAKIVSGAGATASCSQTWTGSDSAEMSIMAVKSATSVASSVSNQFPRVQ